MTWWKKIKSGISSAAKVVGHDIAVAAGATADAAVAVGSAAEAAAIHFGNGVASGDPMSIAELALIVCTAGAGAAVAGGFVGGEVAGAMIAAEGSEMLLGGGEIALGVGEAAEVAAASAEAVEVGGEVGIELTTFSAEGGVEVSGAGAQAAEVGGEEGIELTTFSAEGGVQVSEVQTSNLLQLEEFEASVGGEQTVATELDAQLGWGVEEESGFAELDAAEEEAALEREAAEALETDPLLGDQTVQSTQRLGRAIDLEVVEEAELAEEFETIPLETTPLLEPFEIEAGESAESAVDRFHASLNGINSSKVALAALATSASLSFADPEVRKAFMTGAEKSIEEFDENEVLIDGGDGGGEGDIFDELIDDVVDGDGDDEEEGVDVEDMVDNLPELPNSDSVDGVDDEDGGSRQPEKGIDEGVTGSGVLEGQESLGRQSYRIPGASIRGRPLFSYTDGHKSTGSVRFALVNEIGMVRRYEGRVHPSSSSTWYGHWTGLAPRADSLPVKVRSPKGVLRFSCLDTYAMAYAIDLDDFGFYHKESEQLFMNRIKRALEVGNIAVAVDRDEYDTAKRMIQKFVDDGHLFGVATADPEDQSRIERAFIRSNVAQEVDIPFDASPNMVLSGRAEETLRTSLSARTADSTAALSQLMYGTHKRVRTHSANPHGYFTAHGVNTMQEALGYMEQMGMKSSFEYSWMRETFARARQASDAAAQFMTQVANTADEVSRDVGRTLQPLNVQAISRPTKLPRSVQMKLRENDISKEIQQKVTESVLLHLLDGE